MSNKQEFLDISVSPQHLLNAAKEIDKCLESMLPPDRYIGHEDVLVMALVARVGINGARRLVGVN